MQFIELLFLILVAQCYFLKLLFDYLGNEQQQKEQPQPQPRGISSKVSFEEAVAAFKKEQSCMYSAYCWFDFTFKLVAHKRKTFWNGCVLFCWKISCWTFIVPIQNLYLVILASRPQTAASAFDENNLNAAQFIQVTESFMGEAPTMNVFRQLASFVREGYVETEEERMIRITKVFVWHVVKLMLV